MKRNKMNKDRLRTREEILQKLKPLEENRSAFRHSFLWSRVFSGEVKLTPVQREVEAMLAKRWMKMLDKGELYVFSDFGQGLVNGLYYALEWMLGEDWPDLKAILKLHKESAAKTTPSTTAKELRRDEDELRIGGRPN